MNKEDIKKYCLRNASHIIADYFTNKFIEKRKAGLVPILIEDYFDSLYFLKCDEKGYPKTREFRTLNTFGKLSYMTVNEEAEIVAETSHVESFSIYIEKPLLLQKLDNFFLEKDIDNQYSNWVWLWAGKIYDRRKIPIEELNIKELLKLTQSIIKKREGIIIDEAFRNKIYK